MINTKDTVEGYIPVVTNHSKTCWGCDLWSPMDEEFRCLKEDDIVSCVARADNTIVIFKKEIK